jgi:hypothetical protein
VGAEVAQWRYNFSFVGEEIKAAKWLKKKKKMGGEGRRTEGNDPAWWPLSEHGSWTR